jgi:hypothetical protein
LFDDERLNAMRKASAALAYPDGSERAAAELVRLAGGAA